MLSIPVKTVLALLSVGVVLAGMSLVTPAFAARECTDAENSAGWHYCNRIDMGGDPWKYRSCLAKFYFNMHHCEVRMHTWRK